MEDSQDFVRVVRILEYSGPRQWVEKTMERNAVKGTRHFGRGQIIREGVLGDYPEQLGGDLNGEVNKLLHDVADLPLTTAKEVRAVKYQAEQILGR